MNRSKRLLSVLLILILSPFDEILAKENNVNEQAHRILQEFFDASDTPGLAVSVGLRGKIIWSEGFGLIGASVCFN